MKNNLKKGITFFLTVLLIFGGIRFYYHLTDDFRISNMTYQLPFEAPWVVPPLTIDEHKHLAQIVNQKFSYIGKGAQCYAFASEDQQYVLKFFKFKHLKPNVFIEFLPPIFPFKDYRQKCIERKKRKLVSVFNGYDLAFRENREIAQLIYLHLIPTTHLKLKVIVSDKIGLEREISLDEVVFLIQKKGDTLRTRLHHFLKQNRLEEAKKAISDILKMYLIEYKKGICDHDHGVMHNTGFIENQPFHLDVGKLNKDSRMCNVDVFKEDLEHVVWKIDSWIHGSYPRYYEEISNFLAQNYELLTGDSIDFKTLDAKYFKKNRMHVSGYLQIVFNEPIPLF